MEGKNGMLFCDGIDVSDYQGAIDWKAARASGLTFAIAKATQGTHNVQDTFASNLAGMRAAGLTAGAYHFLDWNVDPVAQAQHFLSVYRPQNGDLPPTLDCEACTVRSNDAIASIAAFLRTVEPHLGGARMLLYLSYSFPDDHLNGGSGFSGHPLWVAAYNSDPNPPVPAAWAKATMWQWTDHASVPGVSGPVDGDRFCGSIADLHAFTLRGIA